MFSFDSCDVPYNGLKVGIVMCFLYTKYAAVVGNLS